MAENGLNALSMLRDSWLARDEFRYQVVRLASYVPAEISIDAIAQVFLDNQMPLMSGVEVVREVRRLGSRVFVCGLTGNALRDDQEEYMSAGVRHPLAVDAVDQKKLMPSSFRTF